MIRVCYLLGISAYLSMFFMLNAVAEHLFVFDFDLTLTTESTFQKTFDSTILRNHVTGEEELLVNVEGEKVRFHVDDNSTKPGTADTLKRILNAGHKIAIATFHTRPDVIMFYLKKAGLGGGDLQKIKIYSRESAQQPLPENKNAMIDRAIVDFEKEDNVKIDGVTFVDTDAELVSAFKQAFAGRFDGAKMSGINGQIVDIERPGDVGHFDIINYQLLPKFSKCHPTADRSDCLVGGRPILSDENLSMVSRVVSLAALSSGSTIFPDLKSAREYINDPKTPKRAYAFWVQEGRSDRLGLLRKGKVNSMTEINPFSTDSCQDVINIEHAMFSLSGNPDQKILGYRWKGSQDTLAERAAGVREFIMRDEEGNAGPIKVLKKDGKLYIWTLDGWMGPKGEKIDIK